MGDTFLAFYTQLEARDKINKVFQNFFRALAGLSDATVVFVLARCCNALGLSSISDSSESESELLNLQARTLKAVSFKLGRAFEDARVMSWVLKAPNDFRSIFRQLPGKEEAKAC